MYIVCEYTTEPTRLCEDPLYIARYRRYTLNTKQQSQWAEHTIHTFYIAIVDVLLAIYYILYTIVREGPFHSTILCVLDHCTGRIDQSFVKPVDLAWLMIAE